MQLNSGIYSGLFIQIVLPEDWGGICCWEKGGGGVVASGLPSHCSLSDFSPSFLPSLPHLCNYTGYHLTLTSGLIYTLPNGNLSQNKAKRSAISQHFLCGYSSCGPVSLDHDLLGVSWPQIFIFAYKFIANTNHESAALSKCFVAVGSIELGVVGSKCQVPLHARGFLVKSNVE